MHTTPPAVPGQSPTRTRESVTDTLTNASIEADPTRQCLRLTFRFPGTGTSFLTELSPRFALSLGAKVTGLAQGLLVAPVRSTAAAAPRPDHITDVFDGEGQP